MSSPDLPTRDAPALPPVAGPVAETMQRIHAELRAGRAPSFEAMLAYGVPEATSAA